MYRGNQNITPLEVVLVIWSSLKSPVKHRGRKVKPISAKSKQVWQSLKGGKNKVAEKPCGDGFSGFWNRMSEIEWRQMWLIGRAICQSGTTAAGKCHFKRIVQFR